MESDWGSEFGAFTNYLTTNDIIYKISYPHTHQQNGTTERKHRHVKNGSYFAC